MRRAVALVLSLTLTGCAARGAHVAARPDRRHDWASVVAIPRGTYVRVTLAGYVYGYVEEVTEGSLTIRDPMRTMSRGLVTRVEVEVRKKNVWAWLAYPFFFGAVGGLVGALVGAVMKDAKVAGISLAVFFAGSFGYLFSWGHWSDRDWRAVYMRP